MISAAPIAPPLLIGEKRVLLRNISWDGYQQLLKILGDDRSARLTFDRGTLEITMPLEEHEFSRCLIGLLIRILAVELGFKIKTMGSTTLDRSDLERGAEPDNAYIQTLQRFSELEKLMTIQTSCRHPEAIGG